MYVYTRSSVVTNQIVLFVYNKTISPSRGFEPGTSGLEIQIYRCFISSPKVRVFEQKSSDVKVFKQTHVCMFNQLSGIASSSSFAALSYFFLNGPNPASFCLFSFFSHDKCSTNTTNEKAQMVCLGFEPGAVGWQAYTNPLSYGGTPHKLFFKMGHRSLFLFIFSLLQTNFTLFTTN